MAEFNGNAIYLRMNSINVESLWKSVTLTQKVGDEEVTAGSGTVYSEHAAKLVDVDIEIKLAYNDAQAATDMANLYTVNRIIPVVYGPEGNTAGKPCDNRSYLITDIDGPNTSVDKTVTEVVFKGKGTGTPTKDFFKGETF